MYKTSEEFQKAAKELLDMAEAHDRGEIPTHKLLYAWKIFYKMGSEYLETLKSEADSNPKWN
jgi:predicted transcriptional regulator